MQFSNVTGALLIQDSTEQYPDLCSSELFPVSEGTQQSELSKSNCLLLIEQNIMCLGTVVRS